jgi:hypothetical protein
VVSPNTFDPYLVLVSLTSACFAGIMADNLSLRVSVEENLAATLGVYKIKPVLL